MLFESLSRFPFHPQWQTSDKSQLIGEIKMVPAGSKVLDIGCASKWTKNYLHKDIDYLGLDYYETATNWYKSTPDIYADAHCIPLKDNYFDHIFLFEVLEHLEDPEAAIRECYRVLKTGGKLVASVPFLYPLHDEPRDFYRFSKHAIQTLSTKNCFSSSKTKAKGHPVETAALLMNISLAKTSLNLIKNRNPMMIATPLLPLIILTINIIASIICKLTPNDDFMPFSYIFILEK